MIFKLYHNILFSMSMFIFVKFRFGRLKNQKRYQSSKAIKVLCISLMYLSY